MSKHVAANIYFETPCGFNDAVLAIVQLPLMLLANQNLLQYILEALSMQ